jgi:hypothetical protein
MKKEILDKERKRYWIKREEASRRLASSLFIPITASRAERKLRIKRVFIKPRLVTSDDMALLAVMTGVCY